MSFCVVMFNDKPIIVPIKWVFEFDPKQFKKNSKKSYMCYINKNLNCEPVWDANLYSTEITDNETIKKVYVKKIFGKLMHFSSI